MPRNGVAVPTPPLTIVEQAISNVAFVGGSSRMLRDSEIRRHASANSSFERSSDVGCRFQAMLECRA